MSISERMAMQARAAAASHVKPVTAVKKATTVSVTNRAAKQANIAKADSNRAGHGAPPEARKPVSSMSAAQRIARQGTVAKQGSVAAAKVPPPPDTKPVATMSAADRIQKQAIVASAQKRGDVKAEVNKDFLAKLKLEYAEFVKKLMAEMEKEGPLYFAGQTAPANKAEPVADKVNGISTAEGEMVVEAAPSEPVPGMPFQATPVITTPSKRKSRKKKEADAATV